MTQLFHLTEDPDETLNLAGLPESLETETRLRLLALEEVMKTNVRNAAITQGDNPPGSRTGETAPEENLPKGVEWIADLP